MTVGGNADHFRPSRNCYEHIIPLKGCFNHIGVSCDNIEKSLNEVEKLGVEVLREPVKSHSRLNELLLYYSDDTSLREIIYMLNRR